LKKKIHVAAHCFGRGSIVSKASHFKILLGGFNVAKINQWEVKDPLKFTIHPDWSKDAKKFDADLAVIEMTRTVKFSANIQRVCLPESTGLQYNKMGTIVGYGITESGSMSDTPRTIKVPSVDTADCVLSNPSYTMFMSKRMFCAGSKGRIACIGDSGAAFIEQTRNGAFVINGIVSSSEMRRNEANCNSDAPTALTNVPMFVDWIENIGN
jgi:secreted trypsin-like serine protease